MTDNNNTVSEFDFIDWEPAERANPYMAVAQALADLNDPDKGYSVIVHKSEAIRTRTEFAKAAHAANRTARVRVNGALIEGTDNVRFVWTMTTKHKPRKGKEREEMLLREALEQGETPEVDNTVVEEPVVTPKPRKPRQA